MLALYLTPIIHKKEWQGMYLPSHLKELKKLDTCGNNDLKDCGYQAMETVTLEWQKTDKKSLANASA